MAGRSAHAGAPGALWLEVEVRDGLGRACVARCARVGARFGALVVERPGVGGDSLTGCRCDCGALVKARTRQLYRGTTTRCPRCKHRKAGLARRRPQRVRDLFHDDAAAIDRWAHRYTGMVSRCYDPGHRAYPNYGGRGVRVHAPWLADREEFYRYAVTLDGWRTAGLDLDRIDNAGHYEPGNLRLVPRSVNARNRRGAAYVEFEGARLPLVEFHERHCPQWTRGNLYYHFARGRTAEWVVARYRLGRAGL